MNPDQNRILVVKLADIGDAVLALPAIQALRSAASTSNIDVLTTAAGSTVFERSPAIDNVVTLRKQQFDQLTGLASLQGITNLFGLARRLRRNRYDVVVLLHHLTTRFGAMKFHALVAATGAPVISGLDNGRGSFLTHRATDFGFGQLTEWEYGLEIIRAIGVQPCATRPEISISESARHSIRALLTTHGIRDTYAVMHTEVGEFSPARAWPDEHFASLASEIHQRYGIPVVLVGTNTERPGLAKISEVAGVFNLVGQTSFDELCALITGATMVIGADSSVAHLASAFDRPLLTLFGPSNQEAWRPFGSQILKAGSDLESDARQVALTRDLPCSPCIYRGFSLGRPQGCRSRRCMTWMLPDEAIRALEKIHPVRLDGRITEAQLGPDGEN